MPLRGEVMESYHIKNGGFSPFFFFFLSVRVLHIPTAGGIS